MRQVPLLPGEGYSASTQQFQSQPRSSRLLRILIVIWVLGGLGFFAFRLQPGKPATTEAAAQPAKTSVTAISTEDMLRHLNTVSDKLIRASASLRRAQDQLARTLQSIDQNYQLVEKRRIENAMAITDAARRELEQGREEAQLVINSMKKEHD